VQRGLAFSHAAIIGLLRAYLCGVRMAGASWVIGNGR
jgi:broad specificity phosphatase PhoE